jgi:hypothetical protein
VGLVDNQPGFEVIDVVVEEKIILFAEVHDDAGHFRFRQHGREDLVDEPVPVLAAQQSRNDGVLRQLFPAFRTKVFERQYERSCVIAVGPLPQCGEVDPVRPVSARIDKAVFVLVGNEKLLAADISLHGLERLRDGLLGKAPGKHAQLVEHRVLFRLRRRATRHREDEQQQEKSCPEYHGTPPDSDNSRLILLRKSATYKRGGTVPTCHTAIFTYIPRWARCS